jgi:hypothetical protein
MNPYRLDWTTTSRQQQKEKEWNLYESVTAVTVHTQGQDVVTSWHDVQGTWGYFPDADPQKWTHARETWILYDQWAVVKGIVTGTIDPDLLL